MRTVMFDVPAMPFTVVHSGSITFSLIYHVFDGLNPRASPYDTDEWCAMTEVSALVVIEPTVTSDVHAMSDGRRVLFAINTSLVAVGSIVVGVGMSTVKGFAHRP